MVPRRAGWGRDRACRTWTRRSGGERLRWRENVYAFFAQQSAQRDQRQPDERGGIAAFDSLEERDAQPFRLDGTGAVERRLAVEIGADFRRIQRAERAGDIDQRRRRSGRLRRRPARRRYERPRSCRKARAVGRMPRPASPVCRPAAPAQSAIWSEPMTSASGNLTATARALASARRSAVCAGASPGSAASSTPGAATRNGSPRRSSSAAR